MTYGIFNSDSANWTEAEAVESDFYSREDAELAIKTRYPDDDDLIIHEIEEPETDESDCEICGSILDDDGICQECEMEDEYV